MLTTTQFKISQDTLNRLAKCSSDEELGYLFETNSFSIELEEYLFEKMDSCPTDKSYLELVLEELSRLGLLLLPTSAEVVG